MNKHKPTCFKVMANEGGPCTCGLDDPPPVTLHTVAAIVSTGSGGGQVGRGQCCPHCKGTGRLTTPEPPEYKSVEPYVGGEPSRTHFEAKPIYKSHAT